MFACINFHSIESERLMSSEHLQANLPAVDIRNGSHSSYLAEITRQQLSQEAMSSR